ncbi:hypothetical protein Lal_00004723 [Lupinus albus]|uniref:Glycosyltransferase family 92 protein n=1 Tax=Lupinus albus TaxID=3870 RepID=A0A6A4NGQ8_LUPAL|nr:putative Glycosyltransferase family 92, nucleotide-diphospho-sugar transferase [Lupinus albus]KAF1865349.1 hypothetical protein Lal_00004723 [Lupinus albus]
MSSHYSRWEIMRRRPNTTFLITFITFLILFAFFSLNLSRYALSRFRYSDSVFDLDTRHNNNDDNNVFLHEYNHPKRRVSSIHFKLSISTVSVLLPDWEILLIVSPNTPLHYAYNYRCIFQNGAFSPARFFGVLPFMNVTTFKCDLPESVRRRRIFSKPALVTEASENEIDDPSPAPELLRWNFLVYESFSTEDDVVLFAKGVNHRQGYDRSPSELRCVFTMGDGNTVTTAVTSSVQEVFRCPHPDHVLLFQESEKIGISLVIIAENLVVPSVASYILRPRPNYAIKAQAQPKYFLCACTMVYNVGKFLREWVMYHSKVGVENFILYDNNSDDNLETVVNELHEEGYNITTLLWIWPKTQEAGFSHSILHSKSNGLCSWIMYVDVDEFVFSPSWKSQNEFPSLKSMLLHQQMSNVGHIGQVSMQCNEFGPSGQRKNPMEGVTQGYTCRRRVEQRHKSIVLVDAVDPGLRNVIHHFEVNEKQGYRSKQLSMENGVVNHYKYQAWDEFKNKFRRRVSAYVVDWRQNVNLKSKDRTPGLGFQPIEPKDWVHKFCEVRDQRLKSLTRAWFSIKLRHNETRMAWQKS